MTAPVALPERDAALTTSMMLVAQAPAGAPVPTRSAEELRGAQAVFATSRDIRTAAGAAAQRAIEARWGPVRVGPGTGGPDEIRICLGRFGCWNIKIEIKISSAD